MCSEQFNLTNVFLFLFIALRISTILSERWQETALLFFLALAFRVGKKINVLFVRWRFLVQMLNFSTIFALLTTVLCMARCGKSAMIFRRNRKIANCNEFRLGIQPQ